MYNFRKVIALLATGVMSVSMFTGCGDKDKKESSSSSVAESSSTSSESSEESEEETTVTTAKTETTETVTTTTTHISPIENVSYSMGNELGQINEILNYDTKKTYKAKLTDLADEGDKIESFTFVFYAEDGVSNIGSYTGACGISVAENCPSATDDYWYQSADFEVSVNSAYAEIKWDVPAEIRDYITINDSSSIQIGYWWGGVQSLRLESIICNYSTSFEIPVDNTKTVECGNTLNYNSESSKTVKLPLEDLVEKGQIPQYFEFNVEGSAPLKKISGAFGISVSDSCPAKTDDYWYQEKNFAVMTGSNTALLHWRVPDEIKEYISEEGEVMLGYWWSESENITLKSVTVKSSIGGVSSSTADNSGSAEDKVKNDISESQIPKDADMKNITSQQIVDDMRIGWNLGNTLDCYNIEDAVTVEDYETGWGNPVTTKAMIDAIKDAGFNAVRIPVSWTNHISNDGTIDSEWLDRVNEVVDYVIDNDMYAIINVHHDDYTWLKPTYAEKEKVKAKLIRIWEQIAERFRDYDEKLLFEGMNEPRLVGSDTEWTGGTPEERDVINDLFQAFVDTVRKAGGNNEYRHLIITSHAASITNDAVSAVKVPNDDRIIVSIHNYAPWEFVDAESSKADWGSDTEKKSLDANFDFLKQTFIDKGVPVIIGEFGSTNKENYAERTEHIEYYVKSAKQRGITCFIWDNGLTSEFGMMNRESLTWYFPDMINSAVNASK